MKIGDFFFNSYEEYQAAYVRMWERVHSNIPVDLTWVETDWNMRKSNPELYK